MSKSFEPIIVAFCCNECAYAAADLAGISRIQTPTNVRIVRVPCTGQVDIAYILRAFERGADGVVVAGCLRDQCHYLDGNLKAYKRVEFLKKVLDMIGLSGQRLEMFFVSAAMSAQFAQHLKEMTQRIKEYGPVPFKSDRTYEMENKREVLHEIIKSMVKSLDKAPVRQDIVEDDEKFGEPQFDQQKCIGCGACAEICSQGAIFINDSDGKRSVRHLYWKCVACGDCEAACYIKAIKINKGFRIVDFLSEKAREDVTVSLFRCKICGNAFIPTPEQSMVLENLCEKLSTSPEIRENLNDIISYCEKCKHRIYANRFHTHLRTDLFGNSETFFLHSETKRSKEENKLD